MGRRTGHGQEKACALFIGFELRSEGTLSCWLPTVEKIKHKSGWHYLARKMWPPSLSSEPEKSKN